MTTNLAILVGSWFTTSLLGIAVIILYLLYGGESLWFQAVALAQGIFSTVLLISLVASFVFLYFKVN